MLRSERNQVRRRGSICISSIRKQLIVEALAVFCLISTVRASTEITVDQAINSIGNPAPPSFFSNREDCRASIQKDPSMLPLCWCGCCRNEQNLRNGCFCPECDRRKSSIAELMVTPSFRTPMKQFEPLLCPLELESGDPNGCQATSMWNVESLVDTTASDTPSGALQPK